MNARETIQHQRSEEEDLLFRVQPAPETFLRQDTRKAYMRRKGRIGARIFIIASWLLWLDLLAVRGQMSPACDALESAGWIVGGCLNLLFGSLWGYFLGLTYGLIVWDTREQVRS